MENKARGSFAKLVELILHQSFYYIGNGYNVILIRWLHFVPTIIKRTIEMKLEESREAQND